MANQVTVSNNNTINVTVEPPANVQVQVSRAVIGTVANVQNANLANYVTQPNQSNITSVGTLTGLTSNGNITAPFFIGNVVGNISGNIVVPGSNTAILFNQNGSAGASDALTFNYSSNVLTANGNIVANYYSGNGSQLTGITATSANYANFAGNVTNSAQPNITSVGTLTGLVVAGDITPSSNVTHSLGNNTNRFNDLYLAGNTIYLGAQEISSNSTNITFTGILSGNANGLSNIAGANVTGQVGNALVASTVYTNAQPNITSVGNLTSLTVSGDAGIAGNLSVGGNLTYINVTNLVVQDPVIEMGGGPNGAPLTTNDGKDRGSLLHYYTTQPVDAFMGWDNGNGEFAFGSNVTNNSDVMTFNQLGNVRAQTFIGNLTGLASSATVAASANSVAGANVSGAVAYATTANAVAGANVSGQVSYAAIANSVAVGNVSGIGNIATINLNGNGSQVLAGNGSWIAQSGGNTTNANYANFAGTVITNAQPNITSVGTLSNLSVTGNVSGGNIISSTFQAAGSGGGTLKNASGASQLQWGGGGGNNITVDVPINISPANGQVDISPTGNGGHVHIKPTGNNAVEIAPTTAGVINNMIIGNVTPQAANVTTLGASGNVTASYFIGNGSSLTDLNGSNVTGAVAYATTANSVALANVSGAGNIASVNLDGNVSNLLTGAGTYVAIPTGGGDANFANYAGNVTVSAQPNITSLGNLPYLQVSDSANANAVISQFASNTSSIPFVTNFANQTSYQLKTIYHPTNSIGYPGDRVIRSRGTASSPTTASNGDRIYQQTGLVYNGTTNPVATSLTTSATGTVNGNANAAWTGGQFIFTTGNPAGDIGNTTSSTPQNILTFNNGGGLIITPGTAPNTSLGQSTSSLLLSSFGQSTANLVRVGGLNFQRARGNRDSVQSVQPGDHVGVSYFVAYSNGAYQSSNVASYTVSVDSTYVANDVVVPMSHQFTSISNVAGVATFKTTSFYGNGLASFPDGITANGTANVNALNVTGTSNLGAVGNIIITGGTANYVLSTDGAGNLDWVAQSGGGGTPGGNTTELQYNNAGSFAGMANVTYDGSNISLGDISTVKIAGGSANDFIKTDGTGNLSFGGIATNLIVGTRISPVTILISNYQMNVLARTGNVVVYVN